MRALGRCPTERRRPRLWGRKRGLQATIQAELSRETQTLLGPESLADFEAVETALRRRVMAVAARLLAQRLNADLSDHTGPAIGCPCGGEARYAGRRDKRFHTVLGVVELSRAYYYCASCQSGSCPRDRALGMDATSLSPALVRMVGAVGAAASFQEGSALLRELAGVELDAKRVERAAEKLGAEIAMDERAFARPNDQGPLPATLYLAVDGTGVPMHRSELVGRAGKQPDGSAKTREAKLCAVWSAEARDEENRPVRDPGSVSYTAAIESAACPDASPKTSPFAERVLREAQRRRFDQAQRRVLLGDGAPWIWHLAEMHLPDAIQIVDLFHAKQHLSDIAKAVYGPTSNLAFAWAKRRHAELDSGQIDAILKALGRLASHSHEAKNGIDYVRANSHRMQYPRFRAAGLCVSSAVIEAGCKLVVATRFKRAGMHWTTNGANAILALRCCRLSGRFEDFWERRSTAA
jgi:hypothetical protein